MTDAWDRQVADNDSDLEVLTNLVRQTGSIPRLGFRAMCLQDSPLGIRFADLVSAFSSGVNVAATWDRGLAYAQGAAMGYEHRNKGVDF